MIVYLTKSTRSDKKLLATITHDDGKICKVHFGANGYSDYTIHKDAARKERYESRHNSREDWTASGVCSAGFWSKWILWNEPSLEKSISSTARRFNIKIVNNI